jgi:hypothetical protein
MEKQIRDDVLSLNNSKFGDFVDRIYPIEHLQWSIYLSVDPIFQSWWFASGFP